MGTTITQNIKKLNEFSEQSDDNTRQKREYSDLLKELINYGEKVININDQTIDIRSIFFILF